MYRLFFCCKVDIKHSVRETCSVSLRRANDSSSQKKQKNNSLRFENLFPKIYDCEINKSVNVFSELIIIFLQGLGQRPVPVQNFNF
jgi:hypothetical protein